MSSIPLYSPVNDHQRTSSLSAVVTIDVPANANAVLIQAIDQNVRIKLKGNASGVQGFRITAGNDPVLIPIGSSSFTVQQEAATATLEYQFVRVHGLGA